jgi:hypothetical protein
MSFLMMVSPGLTRFMLRRSERLHQWMLSSCIFGNPGRSVGSASDGVGVIFYNASPADILHRASRMRAWAWSLMLSGMNGSAIAAALP